MRHDDDFIERLAYATVTTLIGLAVLGMGIFFVADGVGQLLLWWARS